VAWRGVERRMHKGSEPSMANVSSREKTSA
jgi:hypothetical protein